MIHGEVQSWQLVIGGEVCSLTGISLQCILVNVPSREEQLCVCKILKEKNKRHLLLFQVYVSLFEECDFRQNYVTTVSRFNVVERFVLPSDPESYEYLGLKWKTKAPSWR